VGWAFLGERLPRSGCVLLVSGRASVELAQKAMLAGIPLLAAVSAPSSLAIELAEKAGLTLVGFLRGPSITQPVLVGPRGRPCRHFLRCLPKNAAMRWRASWADGSW
jgi:2-keto-3-deoxy-6-phosphogluconate aldolase